MPPPHRPSADASPPSSEEKSGAPLAYLFFGAFSGFPPTLERLRKRIEADFGRIHERGVSPPYPFPETAAYARSMGRCLERRFFVLEKLWPQDGLAAVKRWAIRVEAEIAASGPDDEHPEAAAGAEPRQWPVARPVNIDPGLLDGSRILLASTRFRPHRIYRGDGIWEEVTLRHDGAEWKALPWTYPDFAAPTYHAFFEPFRRLLSEEEKSARPRSPRPDSPPHA
jgi:hypothetical protein